MTLKRFLVGFVVTLTKSLTKNPSRNRFNVILLGEKTRALDSQHLAFGTLILKRSVRDAQPETLSLIRLAWGRSAWNKQVRQAKQLT